jgi:hypothetical protein
MMFRLAFAGFLGWCLVGSPGQAAAEGAGGVVAKAQAQLDRLEFEEARETLERAERQGELGPEELGEIYRLSGIVAGAYGDEDTAEYHFSKWLAIWPDAELGEGLAPRISEPFVRARIATEARGHLRVSRVTSSDRKAVGLVVEADPLEMVAGALARFETPDGVVREVRATGRSPYMLSVPQGVRGEIALYALDEHGNRLLAHAVSSAPRAGAPYASLTASKADGSTARPPMYAHWIVWAGVASSLAGASAYFGLRAQGDQRELDGLIRSSREHEYGVAEQVEARGRRHARVANATGIAAGAAGAAAVVLMVTQPRAKRSPEPRAARAFAAPIRGGAAAGITLSF